MRTYRVDVQAEVCFYPRAESEEEALALVRRFLALEGVADGIEIEDSDIPESPAVVFFRDDAAASIEDSWE